MDYVVESYGSEIIVVHLQNCNYLEAEVYHSLNASRYSVMFNELLQNWNNNATQNAAKIGVYKILQSN